MSIAINQTEATVGVDAGQQTGHLQQEIRHHVQDVIARFADQHPGVRKSIAIVLVLILIGMAWSEREMGIDNVNAMQATETYRSAFIGVTTILAIAGLAFLFVQGILSGTQGRISTFLMIMGAALGIYRSATIYQSMIGAATLQNTAQAALMSRIRGIEKSIAEHEATLKSKKEAINPNSGLDESARARLDLSRQRQKAASKQADSVFRESRADGTWALSQASKDLEAAEKIQEKKAVGQKEAQSEVDKEQAIVDGLRTEKSELEHKVKPTSEGIFGDFGFKVKTMFVALVFMGVEWLSATLLGTIVAAFGFASRSAALQRAAMEEPAVQPVMPEMPEPPDMAGAMKGAAEVATGVATATTIALNPAAAQEPAPSVPQVAVVHQQAAVTGWRFQVEVPPTSTYAAPATSTCTSTPAYTQVEVESTPQVEVLAQNGDISASQVEVGTENTGIKAPQVEVSPDAGRGLDGCQVEVDATSTCTSTQVEVTNAEQVEVFQSAGVLSGIPSPYTELVYAIRNWQIKPNIPSVKKFMRCGQPTAEEYLERLKGDGFISGGGQGKPYKVVEVQA